MAIAPRDDPQSCCWPGLHAAEWAGHAGKLGSLRGCGAVQAATVQPSTELAGHAQQLCGPTCAAQSRSTSFWDTGTENLRLQARAERRRGAA